jgi:hypothetical protein
MLREWIRGLFSGHGLLMLVGAALILMAMFLYSVPEQLETDAQFMGAGFVLEIVTFVVAAAGVWLVTRAMDLAAQIEFKEAYDRIETNPMALAVYFGTRLLALAFLAGTIFQ